jgi:hypothetical protein
MSKYSRFLFALAMLASIVLLVACTPAPAPAPAEKPAPPPPCPPIGPMAKKVSISDNPAYSSSDGSSIEVFADTYAYTDPGDVPWCDTDDLDIAPEDLGALPPCPYTKCLAAVNVTPDNIKCPSSKNTSATKPRLSYDLDEHPPAKSPENCGGSAYCYSIYQFRSSTSTWRYVGYAKAIQVGPEWFAEGRIYHFSIFALVELPDPTTVSGPRTMGMIVASDFIEDDRGDISVGVIVFEDSLGEFDQAGEQRLFRFSGVDPASYEGDVPPDCEALPSVAEQFTCLFPIDTAVEFELAEQGQAVLLAPEMGYGVVFFVSDVQIY